MLQTPQKYKYAYQSSTLLKGILGFGAGAGFFGWLSVTAENGLRIGRVSKVDFSVEEAKMIYLVLAILSGLVALGTLFSFYKQKTQEAFVEIQTDHLLLPDGFVNAGVKKIFYASIVDLEEEEEDKSKSLKIQTKEDDTYYLKADKLPNYNIYAEIRDFLGEKFKKPAA